MAAMRYVARWAVLFLGASILIGDTECFCEASDPKLYETRQCSLCREADKQPAAEPYFFLKDSNPTKPNRWLILPRKHSPGIHPLSIEPKELQTRIWTAAVQRARSLWGDQWGLAYNGDHVRTQCHAHIHIGKLLPNVETSNFIVVNGPAEIPMVSEDGLWIHQSGDKLHVHRGEQKTELVLLR
jgi:hypothetical protein